MDGRRSRCEEIHQKRGPSRWRTQEARAQTPPSSRPASQPASQPLDFWASSFFDSSVAYIAIERRERNRDRAIEGDIHT